MLSHNDNLPREYRDDPAALWRQPETWFGYALLVALFALGLWSAGVFG